MILHGDFVHLLLHGSLRLLWLVHWRTWLGGTVVFILEYNGRRGSEGSSIADWCSRLDGSTLAHGMVAVLTFLSCIHSVPDRLWLVFSIIYSCVGSSTKYKCQCLNKETWVQNFQGILIRLSPLNDNGLEYQNWISSTGPREAPLSTYKW